VIQAKPKRAKIISFTDARQDKKTQSKPGALKDDRPTTRVIAITSGKGGVGKTNIVANLGFALCQTGKKVLIFDADLGLGNLDILLGITPHYNLSHVLSGEKQITEIIVDGPGNLKILPASSGIQELTQLTDLQKMNLSRAMNSVLGGFDILLIDTAAGISSDVLYFNASAQEIMVVVTPEPTSITDAYALIKILSMKYKEKNFKLIVNSAASTREADEVFRQLSLVTSRFLDVSVEYFGSVLMDDNVKKGVKKQKVVSEWAPMTHASLGFAVLAKKLSQSKPPEFQEKGSIFCFSSVYHQNVD
jgi:flagellar biosynthesis protein FlhG